MGKHQHYYRIDSYCRCGKAEPGSEAENIQWQRADAVADERERIRAFVKRNTVLVDANDPQERFVHTDDLMWFLDHAKDE